MSAAVPDAARRSRRLRAACVLPLLVLAGAAPPALGAGESYTFISAPDSWNADVADVRGAPGWDSGEPNSINRSWRRATDIVLARMAAHRPAFALVAGDVVNGHWYMDVGHFETLGRVNGMAGKRLAILRAGAIYYSAFKASFERHDLNLHPAVGDHELGDNPWRAGRRRLVPAFRRAWSDAFTFRRGSFVYPRHPRRGTQHAKTAYAFRAGPVMFITVDVFHQGRRGGISLAVRGDQLRWLRRVLRDANRDSTIEFVVVQGHVPVIRPRSGYHSSELSLRGGVRSPFWRLLRSQRVDLYLAGEYHTLAAANHGGVEQLVHGSLFGRGSFSYLTVDVAPSRLELTIYRAPVRRIRRGRLWQLDHKRPFRSRVVGRFRTLGTMRVTAGGRELGRTGRFRLGR